MTREEVVAGVAQLTPWFHCIDLGAGLRTKIESAASEPIDHPQSTWEKLKELIPEDLSGKSLLDVGCNAGFYAVEAKRRNAARVLGIDAQRHHIRQALFVRRVLSLDIQYQRMSVYDLSPHTVGQFDITLALGLIYHCKHLVLALEKLFLVTKHTLILETAILPPEKFPPPFTHGVGGLDRTLHPLAYVGNPPEAKEPVFNWFLPSPESLQSLLKNIGFDEVIVVSAENERAILICRKHNAYTDSRGLNHLAATLTAETAVTTCPPNAELHLRIRAENSGFATWLAHGVPHTEVGAVRLGVHILNDAEEVVSWYHSKVDLGSDLNPGEATSLDISLRAPAAPGRYFLEFDMVAEHLSWFEDLGSTTLRHELIVE